MSPSQFESPQKMSTPEPSTPMPPVQALVIGMGTGDGGPKQQLLETPEGQPDVVANYITPLAAISIRFVIAYLTTLVGLVSGGLATNIIPYSDFYNLVTKCASLSFVMPVIGVGKDLIAYFTALLDRFPKLKV